MFALVLILNAPLLWPQAAPPPVAAAPDAQAAITGALLGRWTGVLEYRDYSEPATSLKRVELPTWLIVSRAPDGLAWSTPMMTDPPRQCQNIAFWF